MYSSNHIVIFVDEYHQTIAEERQNIEGQSRNHVSNIQTQAGN